MNTGGPAFPQKSLPYSTEDKKGMFLRDYFAAKAMSEMTWKDKTGSAQECYEIADAMLEARKK